jgi:hypothetical protein
MKQRARVENNVDAAAEHFAQIPQLIDAIIERLQLAEKVDKEVSRLNQSAPPGWKHVLGPELRARQLESFSNTNPRMGRDMKLPDWAHSELMLWPPRPALNPMFTGVQDVRYSADWHVPGAQRQQQLEHERVDRELADAEAKAEFFRGH